MKKILENIGSFCKKNALGIVWIVLLTASVLAYIWSLDTTEMPLVGHFMFWVLALGGTVLSLDEKYDRPFQWGAVMISFTLMLGMVLIYTLWPEMWLIVSCSVLGIALWGIFYTVTVIGSSGCFFACAGLAIASFASAFVGVEYDFSQYLEKNAPETVVLEYVEKRSAWEVYVKIEDKGILKFDRHVEEPWRYNQGDTVQIVVKDHEIVWCEKHNR